MKKPVSRIRQEIAKLQEQLKKAETRDAERLGRLALRAGLGEHAFDENDLLLAFEDVAVRLRSDAAPVIGPGRLSASFSNREKPTIGSGADTRTTGEG